MFRKIISVITLILVAIVVIGAREQILDAIRYLADTNLWFILLLIPEQLFMYYCAGQMFFSYMSAKKTAKKISKFTLMRIAFELNFVNHAVPSGGFSGLGYIAWRLKPLGASIGQTSFMYILRYVITICANQFQTLVAIVVLLIAGGLNDGKLWLLGVVGASCVAIIAAILIAIVIASSKKRINWFAEKSAKVVNSVVSFVTRGKKQEILKRKVVLDYFGEIHENLIEAKTHKKMLVRPIVWGIIYSFFEVATYWLVGISMGHPEILPQIMVAEAIGSVVGAVLVTPGGVGGYEGAMIAIMSLLGVEIGLATAVVVTTRVVVLVGTIVSGYGFYQHAISTIGKKDKAEIARINESNKVPD